MSPPLCQPQFSHQYSEQITFSLSVIARIYSVMPQECLLSTAVSCQGLGEPLLHASADDPGSSPCPRLTGVCWPPALPWACCVTSGKPLFFSGPSLGSSEGV